MHICLLSGTKFIVMLAWGHRKNTTVCTATFYYKLTVFLSWFPWEKEPARKTSIVYPRRGCRLRVHRSLAHCNLSAHGGKYPASSSIGLSHQKLRIKKWAYSTHCSLCTCHDECSIRSIHACLRLSYAVSLCDRSHCFFSNNRAAILQCCLFRRYSVILYFGLEGTIKWNKNKIFFSCLVRSGDQAALCPRFMKGPDQLRRIAEGLVKFEAQHTM